jgi:hypothetical protein
MTTTDEDLITECDPAADFDACPTCRQAELIAALQALPPGCFPTEAFGLLSTLFLKKG